MENGIPRTINPALIYEPSSMHLASRVGMTSEPWAQWAWKTLQLVLSAAYSYAPKLQQGLSSYH